MSDNIKNRLLGRLSFDFADACHLHFGNLPPIYSKSRKIYIYIHNSLLLENWSQIKEENFKLKFRLILERMFMRIFIRKSHALIVQTRYMERLVNKVFPKNFVKLVKFSDTNVSNTPGKFQSKSASLIYIGEKKI